MPMYVVQRSFTVGPDRMPEIGRRSREIIEDQFPVITWHHSHVTVDDEGYVHTFCIYESPDPESIREHSRVLGYHIIEEIFEIAGDVTPADFPPVKAG